MNFRYPRRPHKAGCASERGTALIVAVVVMAVVLVGGLALVAVTSGELTSSRGYRTRQTTEACADAGLEKIRSLMPDVEAAKNVSEDVSLYGDSSRLRYRAGCYSDDSSGIRTLEEFQFNSEALHQGWNITNRLPGAPDSASSSGGGGVAGVRLMAVTSTCSGDGYGQQEMETIFRYGIPVSGP